jgi:hypothetical protein
MGNVRLNEQGPFVESAEELMNRFQEEVVQVLPAWGQWINEKPHECQQLEQQVQQTFARGADLIVAGLLAVAMKQQAFDERCEKTRQNCSVPLRKGRQRERKVQLLGGLIIWITSLYCAPKEKRGDQSVPGMHVELAQFGFAFGGSPALVSRVARKAALCPSIKMAQQELQRDGVKLDEKKVRRIALQCGEAMLALRHDELMQCRAGTLPVTNEFRGKRICVEIDGGRTKIRGDLRDVTPVKEAENEEGLPAEDAPGRSKPVAKKTYDAEWREPKQVTIFVHDDDGRQEKGSRAVIDATFLGPDALAELIVMHLVRLGAAEAESVTFAADGAPWIWDRIGKIVREAGLTDVTIYEVLDCCHAVHHISAALGALGLSRTERIPLYRSLRSQLRNGRWRAVVSDLEDLASTQPDNAEIRTEIAYLRKHGDAGRMAYPSFKRQGIPRGSGAIESSIRRVINQRLKGNGISWREEHAEAMLQLRATLLSDRWDERLSAVQSHQRTTRPTDWRWEPRPMSCKVEA